MMFDKRKFSYRIKKKKPARMNVKFHKTLRLMIMFLILQVMDQTITQIHQLSNRFQIYIDLIHHMDT